MTTGRPDRAARSAADRAGPDWPDRVDAGVARVRARIATAAARSGRDPAEITLVAVAKLQPITAVRAALAAGVADIGENYAQELLAKVPAVPGARWHFVGRLQRNKARAVVGTGALVHSLDSLSLAAALGRHAVAAGTTARALVQVEPSSRAAAHGVPPAELPAFLAGCQSVAGLRIEGLMVLPPPEDEAAARRAFRVLAELARNLPPGMRDLSMGMTADLEPAVEEGATLVRVGTAIFGPRPATTEGKR